MAPRDALGKLVVPEALGRRVGQADLHLGPEARLEEQPGERLERPGAVRPGGPREQGEEGGAQVLELAVGRRGEGGEVQVAHRVHELGRHELGVGAVELDRVEAPRVLLLGELEQVDPRRLLRRHGVEQASDRVAVGVDERETAPATQVVGGEADELGALAGAGAPQEHDVAGEQVRGHEHRPPAVLPDRPQPGPGRGLRRRQAAAADDLDRAVLGPRARDSPHSSASAQGARRIGADRPPTEASTRQPDARSAPTAPTASNSHARSGPGGGARGLEGRRGREGGSGLPRGGRRRPRRGHRARWPVERGIEEQLAPARPARRLPRPARMGRGRTAIDQDAVAPRGSRAHKLDEVGAEVGDDSRCGLGRLAPDAQPQLTRGLARGLERLELGARIGRGDRGLDHAGELAWRLDLEPRPAVDPAQGEGEGRPAARPARHAAPSTRVQRGDQAPARLRIAGARGIEPQQPARTFARGRVVVGTLAERTERPGSEDRAANEERDAATTEGDREQDIDDRGEERIHGMPSSVERCSDWGDQVDRGLGTGGSPFMAQAAGR